MSGQTGEDVEVDTASSGPGSFRVRDSTVTGRDGAIPVRDYLPDAEDAGAAFLWVHGGGFISGGLDQKESDAPARYLAARGHRVRTIDYRLVTGVRLFREPDLRPQPNRFPAALHDVADVASDLASATGRRIALGGASAGANLAAGATMYLRDQSEAGPIALVLIYGAFHSAVPDNPHVESELRGPLARWWFNPTMVRRIFLGYVGDPALFSPGYAAPGGGDLRAFPPTLSLDAENDRLRASGHAFADELRAVNVEVHEEVVPGAHHGFLNAFTKTPFKNSMHTVDEWLRAHDVLA
jgi:acetyl esterase/lipase